MPVSATTLLDCFLHWEAAQPEAVYCTQAVAPGMVVDYRWRAVGDAVRRMATHLRSLPLPPGSAIAILGESTAHWLMADLAIWMAGHVSVPLHPTIEADAARDVLADSETRLLFVGKMDGRWHGVAPGIPGDLPRIALPFAPAMGGPFAAAMAVRQWHEIVAATPPLADVPRRDADERASILYTVGGTGRPRGDTASFGAMLAVAGERGREWSRATVGPSASAAADRPLACEPLARAAERAAVLAVSLSHGLRISFGSGLATAAALS